MSGTTIKKTEGQPTILDKDVFGCTWSERDGYTLLIPKAPEPDTDMPPEAVALLGAFHRFLNDSQFRQECADWMAAQAEGARTPRKVN